MIWETVSPRTHKPKVVNESLQVRFDKEVQSNFDGSNLSEPSVK